MMQKPPRPTGVTILAILDLIGGVLAIIAGGTLAAVGGSGILGTLGYGSLLGGLVAVLGGAILVFGFLAVTVGYGLWSGKSWAWMVAIALYAIGALFSLGSLALGSYSSIISLAIYALVIWYLMKPHVKAYFGRGTPAQQTATMVQTAPATTP